MSSIVASCSINIGFHCKENGKGYQTLSFNLNVNWVLKVCIASIVITENDCYIAMYNEETFEVLNNALYPKLMLIKVQKR